MYRVRFIAALLFSYVAFDMWTPTVAYAADSLFTQIVPAGSCLCPGSAPDYGCILQLIQNVINASISFGILLCVIWIAFAGFSMITSGGSAEARSLAKTRLLNAVIGIAVILCSWIIVDFVMKAIYQPTTAFNGSQIGPWNAILSGSGNDYCITTTNPEFIVNGSVGLNVGPTPTQPGGTVTSTSQAGGNCSSTAIANDWGNSDQKGNLFSCIINNESKCQNIATQASSQVAGTGSSAGGRYQVLMSTNGLNFPACVAIARANGYTESTFNCGAHYPKGRGDGTLAAQACRKAQLDPTCNTQAAQYLYNNGGVRHWLGVGDIGGKNQSCVTRFGK